jgi:hypothetical protein
MKKCININCNESYVPEDKNWDSGRCPKCQEAFMKFFKTDVKEAENFFSKKEK